MPKFKEALEPLFQISSSFIKTHFFIVKSESQAVDTFLSENPFLAKFFSEFEPTVVSDYEQNMILFKIVC